MEHPPQALTSCNQHHYIQQPAQEKRRKLTPHANNQAHHLPTNKIKLGTR